MESILRKNDRDQWKVDSGRMEQKRKSWAFLHQAEYEGLENYAANARKLLDFLTASTGCWVFLPWWVLGEMAHKPGPWKNLVLGAG